MSITSRDPIDATPPADLFDLADAAKAIEAASAVLGVMEEFDQPPYA